MRIKGTYLFIIMLLACTTGMSQMSVPYSMSPIAVSSGSVTANGGNPFAADGTGKCLNVSSGGLGTLMVANTSKGSFGASCVEVPPVATPLISFTSMNVYPNPAHSTTILKCEGQFDVNLSCRVFVTSMDGKTMMSQMVAMKDVQAGYSITVSSYATGNYIVTVEFMNQRYSKKLIKI